MKADLDLGFHLRVTMEQSGSSQTVSETPSPPPCAYNEISSCKNTGICISIV